VTSFLIGRILNDPAVPGCIFPCQVLLFLRVAFRLIE
jgi:hypothetical protein